LDTGDAGTGSFATFSRRGDLAAFALLLSVLLAVAPSLRVYHRITAVEASVVEIAPDGTRASVPALERLPAGLPADGRRDTVLRWLERSGRQLARDRAASGTPPGTRFEITLRWSENSLRLDRRATILTEAVPPQDP
jgi:hypothetical protein